IVHLDVVIKSILDQTVKPDKIYLCIPKICKRVNIGYIIPNWLNNIPNIEIIRMEEDLGPINKLIPAWLKERHQDNTRIIIIDDDYIYPSHMIESLVSWSNKMPKAAIGLHGIIMENKLSVIPVLTYKINAPCRVDYTVGYSGVLFRAGFFNDSILDYSNAPSGAFFEDDVWIGGQLDRVNVDRFIIPTENNRLRPTMYMVVNNTIGLCNAENRDGKNRDAVFEYLFKKEH
ncbi:MAG: hypothetical protein ACD_26C00163G0001, partial [uncultured bacterium]